jgi:DNA recombination protein RmuC
VVKDSLDRLHSSLRELDEHRISWQSQLRQQVEDVRVSTELLRRETSNLATALRKPHTRGRWGELHLRRAVELAGLTERCDFDEQVSARDDDGILRPDLVVHLAGDKHVVVDSKVPLDAFLDATEADTDEEREHHLARHSRQLRTHVEALAKKRYWESFDPAPEFVVLFVPGEAFLSAALDVEPGLLDDAAAKRVILATPTTLIALLRTVAYAWTQEILADQAKEIHDHARLLHSRLSTMGSHLDKLGRSLKAAVGSYNDTIGSLESRVMVTARKLQELGVTEDDLPAAEPIEIAPRALSAPEFNQTG